MAGNTVLVVDDDEATLMLLKRYLASFGVPALTASSGEDALNLLSAHADVIGMILMDIAMPGMNGIALAKQIRQNPQFDQYPLIVLTARTEIDTQVRAKDAG